MKYLKKSKIKKKYKSFLLIFISFIFGASFFYYQIFPFNYKTKNFIKKNVNFLSKKDLAPNTIESLYYKINIEKILLPSKSRYGGIDFIDNDNLIFVDGDGKIFIYKLNEKKFSKQKNSLSSIIIENRKNFENYYLEQKQNISLLFNVKDIHINDFNKNKIILFSSNYFDENLKCHKINLYKSSIKLKPKIKINEPQLIYSTKDCLNKDLTPIVGFAGGSAGGRIFKLDEQNVLLTIGDFSADGINGPALSQEKSSHFGKIIKIDIFNYQSKIFSLGHRNPQGLFIDKNKNIFSTEHGPRGGDEINNIIKNNNYGWPLASYGEIYSENRPENVYFKNHKKHGFEEPIYAFVPSIGISEIINLPNTFSKKYINNFILTSLYGGNIYRIKFDSDFKKIIFMEKIFIGKRIRDIKYVESLSILVLAFEEKGEIGIIKSSN